MLRRGLLSASVSTSSAATRFSSLSQGRAYRTNVNMRMNCTTSVGGMQSESSLRRWTARAPVAAAAVGLSCGAGNGSHLLRVGQQRHVSWSTFKPENWTTVWRQSTPNVEEELPEVFAEQPQEIDDYIRPDKTFFEKLEDWWDYLIGFVTPVEKQIEMMRWVREVGFLGIPLDYGGVFFLWGVFIRLISLAPQLYVHRNSLRLAAISPQLTEINQLQKKTKSDKTLSAQDKRVIKEGYNRMKQALYKKHKCSQARIMVQGLSTPFMVTTFMAIRRLATYDETLENTNFLWITDLTLPDPTWILPAICVGLFVVNFELNQAMGSSGRTSGRMYTRWAVRGGSVVFLYFFQSQPAACFSYWIGMSLAGLLSPVLLRNETFRKTFSFPPRPAASMEAAERGPFSRLLVKMGLKAPPKPVEAKEEKEDLSGFASVRDFEVLFNEEEVLKEKRGHTVAGPSR